MIGCGDKMKIDHDTTTSHNGNGASKMNAKTGVKKYGGAAEYLASILGPASIETNHPATYGVRRSRVLGYDWTERNRLAMIGR